MDLAQAAPSRTVRTDILLYFNLLPLVLFHGLQFKWRTFMMQMQAGVINLPCSPLLGSPDAKRCALSLSLSLTFSLLQHRVTLAPRPHEK